MHQARHIVAVAALMFVIAAASGAVTPVTIQQLEARFAGGKDTVFVVNFWATWCKPCVKELPHFSALEQDYRDAVPLRVLLVSVDDVKDSAKVARMLASRSYTTQACIVTDRNPHTWIDAVDSSWSGAIPATLFVRRAGLLRRFVEAEFTYQTLVQSFTSFIKDSL